MVEWCFALSLKLEISGQGGGSAVKCISLTLGLLYQMEEWTIEQNIISAVGRVGFAQLSMLCFLCTVSREHSDTEMILLHKAGFSLNMLRDMALSLHES